MKGTPLAYNKDFQEDKEPVFDAIDTVKDTLRAFCDMMAGVEPQADAMHHAAQPAIRRPPTLPTTSSVHGTPFRTAHDIVGQTVRAASERGCGLEDLPLDVLKSFSPAIEEDVYEVLKLEAPSTPATISRHRSRSGCEAGRTLGGDHLRARRQAA